MSDKKNTQPFFQKKKFLVLFLLDSARKNFFFSRHFFLKTLSHFFQQFFQSYFCVIRRENTFFSFLFFFKAFFFQNTQPFFPSFFFQFYFCLIWRENNYFFNVVFFLKQRLPYFSTIYLVTLWLLQVALGLDYQIQVIHHTQKKIFFVSFFIQPPALKDKNNKVSNALNSVN